MENDKKAYSEESEQMLTRQSHLIEKLKDDNKQLCRDMLQHSKDQKKATTVSSTGESEINILKDKINNEIELQKQLEDQMKHA